MKYPFPMKILLATNNEHKKQELEALLPGFDLILPSSLGISFSCVEDGTTFEANAIIKAQALRKASIGQNLPVLADDSGLTVSSLPGLLGVRTARFGAPDEEHLLSAHEKNLLLLEYLKEKADRSACFHCCLVLILPDNSMLIANGKTEGSILFEETGTGGFGFDPVFFCSDANTPMALLSPEEKNFYSHRGRAAKKLLQLLDQNR